MNGLTARLALDTLGLEKGSVLAVTGVAGTMGGYAVQLAKKDGPGTNVGDLCVEIGVTRQTLYRHVSPTGELRSDGAKLLER